MGPHVKWRLVITPRVQETLRVLPPQTKQYIRQALAEIALDPWIGKALRDELAGFYSFRTRRFRIVYRIQEATITVMVVGIGPRETIYEQVSSEIGKRF